MKCMFLLAVLLPFVLGAPQKRYLDLIIHFHSPDLHKVTEIVEGFAHSGLGQSACVTACGTAVSATGVGVVLSQFCPKACSSVLSKLK